MKRLVITYRKNSNPIYDVYIGGIRVYRSRNFSCAMFYYERH